MDDRGPADDRAERAEFAPSRVGGRNGRSWGPLLIAGWIVVLGAVVGAGTIGRALDGSSAALASGSAAGAPSIGAPTTSRAASTAPTRSSDPDPLAYLVVRDATGLSITATILARPVVWVFISIQDAAGDVLAWRSLSVEDPNGGIRPDRAPAFQVHVALSSSLAAGPLIVEVNAYNDLGRKIGSVREPYAERANHNPIRIGSSVVR